MVMIVTCQRVAVKTAIAEVRVWLKMLKQGCAVTRGSTSDRITYSSRIA